MLYIIKDYLKNNFSKTYECLKKIYWFFKGVIFIPPLKNVAVEINSFCNRKCLFCPNLNYAREEVFLEEDLFYKIVDDLKNMRFKGAFTFNLFNEPLLDKRLPEFIKHVRDNLPGAYIYLNTNGDLLTLPLWKKLRAAGLDFADITQYDGKININVQEIANGLDDDEKKHFYCHTLDAIFNRAGLVKTGRATKLPLKKVCWRPFYQLCVNYKGKGVLCCNDYFSSVETGDLHSESIATIWRSQVMRYYRKMLLLKGRAHLRLCDKCDIV